MLKIHLFLYISISPGILGFFYQSENILDAINYCAMPCNGSYTSEHTFCLYPRYQPSASCSGMVDARLSAAEKRDIVGRLNKRRSEVARGMLPGLPPAANMMKMRWVDDLALEAQRWAEQCLPISKVEQHDSCRDLYSVTVGQCIATVVGDAPGLKPETLLDMWYIQRLHYKWNASMTSHKKNLHLYADFEQMLNADSFMVGCGRIRFKSLWQGQPRRVERLVCNFAPRGPTPEYNPWAAGPPASACPDYARADTEFPDLCALPDSTDQYYSALQTTSPVLHTLEQGILVVTLLELANNSALRRPGGLDSFYLATMGKVDPAVTKPYPYVPGFLRDLEDADPIRGENFTSEVHNENKSRRHIRNTALPSSITKYFDTTTPGVLLPKVALDTKLMFPEPDGKNPEPARETDDTKKDQILKTLIDEYGNASVNAFPNFCVTILLLFFGKHVL